MFLEVVGEEPYGFHLLPHGTRPIRNKCNAVTPTGGNVFRCGKYAHISGSLVMGYMAACAWCTRIATL